MKNRMLSVVAGMLMATSLVACSSTTSTETTIEVAVDTETTTLANEESTSETEDPLADAPVFLIGGTGPLTGGAASYGISVKNGVTIAIEEINAAGGVVVGDTTYKLALNFADDEASEDMSVTAYNNLMDAGINMLIGGTTSGASLAITDLTYADGLLQITPSGSAAAITENPNVFRLCFTDPLQGQLIADYVVAQGYESVAVLYNNADEYSTGIYEAFTAQLEVAGKSDLLVDVESFVTEDVDYTTQLTKIKASGAKIIFVPAYYEAAAYITQQARAAGITADFVGSDGWDGVLAQVTDASAVEGAIFLSPFLSSDASAAEFTAKYEAAYGSTPDQFAADGYDTVYVVKAAMEQAGSIESADLIAAMTEITVSGLTGEVSFNENGEPNKEAKYVIITDGKYELYELE